MWDLSRLCRGNPFPKPLPIALLRGSRHSLSGTLLAALLLSAAILIKFVGLKDRAYEYPCSNYGRRNRKPVLAYEHA